MNLLKGKLYGVGVGPGDPKLITLKALEVIKNADFIAIAHTGGENVALNIIKDFAAGKTLLACPMPMTRDEEKLDAAHRKSARIITNILDGGKTVAFVTLGDPTIYSTYMYIHRIISNIGYETEIIPGVTSFCAAAAAFGISLCDGGNPLTIVPASYDGYEKYLKTSGVKILMKSGKNFPSVKEKISEAGLANNTLIAEKCGMEGERLFHDMKESPDDAGYFSVIIVTE